MEMLKAVRPGIATLFKSLASDTKTFIRQELQLAKTELSEKVSRMGKNAAMLAVGGFVAYAGAIVFMIGLGWLAGWGLEAAGVNPTLARFIGLAAVGIIIALIGYVMLSKALKAFSEESLAPERTIQSLQDLKGSDHEEFQYENEGDREELSSEQIHERVQATETRMSDTLEELGYRFSPSVIKEDVRERLAANPYRAGLVAAGIGLAGGLLLRRKLRHA